MNLSLRRALGFTTEVPPEHRKNFAHLYWDVAFWGLLNGSVVNFLGVYCSRIGATPLQMGLLIAIPALMNLIVTLPATIWLRNLPSTRVVPITALITRLFYGLLIPLPMLLPPETRIWVILGIVLFQNITGAIAATIGNAFLAETVPVEWRGQVVGNRNALIAITTMVTSLVVGQVLNNMSFAAGYQVIFALGFAGSMASAYHLFQVKPVLLPPAIPTLDGEIAPAPAAGARMEILRGPFRKLLVMMFLLNIAIFMLSPIFPLYQVNVLHLTDQTISLAAALFGLVQFIVSTQGGAISRRLGFRQMTGLGMTIASFSTMLFTFSFNPLIYFSTQIVGGTGWSIYGGGAVNYLLENVPAHDRSAHLAWFNLTINAAVLMCGLFAASLVGVLGLFGVMLLGIGVRFLVGLAVMKYG